MEKDPFHKLRIPFMLGETLVRVVVRHINGPGAGSLPGAADAARIMSNTLDQAMVQAHGRLEELRRVQPGEGPRDRQAVSRWESIQSKLADLKRIANGIFFSCFLGAAICLQIAAISNNLPYQITRHYFLGVICCVLGCRQQQMARAI
jgi:hypothetical protein